DEIGSGLTEAAVEREAALGSAEIRLLRAAEPWHGARDERAHAPVPDERRPRRESLGETAHLSHSTTSRTRSFGRGGSSDPVNTARGGSPTPPGGGPREGDWTTVRT